MLYFGIAIVVLILANALQQVQIHYLKKSIIRHLDITEKLCVSISFMEKMNAEIKTIDYSVGMLNARTAAMSIAIEQIAVANGMTVQETMH